MPRPKTIISTVKAQADIETPTILTGYLLNGKRNILLGQNSREHQDIQEWIAMGNIPQPAYTSQQLKEHTMNTLKNVNREYLANTDWYVIRENETGKKIPEEIANKRKQARLNI